MTHTLARAPASVLTHQRDTSTPKASEAEMKEKKNTLTVNTNISTPTPKTAVNPLTLTTFLTPRVFLLSKKFSLMTAMCNHFKNDTNKQTTTACCAF